MSFTVHGINMPLITPKNADNFNHILLKAIKDSCNGIKMGDILVISGKVIAIVAGEIIDLRKIKPSTKAIEIARKSKLEPSFVQAVLDRSDKIYGWASGALMTIKDQLLLANAGIDRSNAIEPYYAIPLPSEPKKIAEELKSFFKMAINEDIGVIIADSATRPMRKGTTGLAIAVAGLPEIINDVGKSDLYGYKMLITTRAIADNLVCSAQLLMGESSEQIPACIIRGLPYVGLNDQGRMIIEEDQCIFMRNFHYEEY